MIDSVFAFMIGIMAGFLLIGIHRLINGPQLGKNAAKFSKHKAPKFRF
jgi:hypothetical protein